MKCHACAAELPDDAMFCSSCGTDMSTQSGGLTGPSEHEAALAAANLLRLRRRFPEAEARCIEVLRADPNNVHAHSMLGDVYRDQGRLEDARQWYQLALDLEPTSRADRRKLLALRGDGPWPDEADEAAGSGFTALTWVRFTGLVLAVFLLGAGVAIISRGWRRPDAVPPAPSAITGPTLEIPRVTAGPESRINRMQPDVPIGAATDVPEGDVEPDADTVDAEVEAADAIALSGSLSPATDVTAIVFSDDGRSAVLVLRHRPNDESRSDIVENQIAMDAVRGAHAAMQRAERLECVDVVVRLGTSAVGEYTALRARADRSRIAANVDVSTGERALRSLTWYRWTPGWRSDGRPSLAAPGP